MSKFKSYLYVFLLTVIILGVAFRFFHLDYKLYWHDEVYTTLRSAGYLSLEVGKEIFSDRLFSAQELLQYQNIKPQSSAWDTIISLAKEDPQHPPLYFLVNRLWMQIFGSSIWAMRLLPALISLAGLPLMYLLAQSLFNCPPCAWLATAFLAISPCDILFSQIARQYALLTVCTIAGCLFLLKAMSNGWHGCWLVSSHWFIYPSLLRFHHNCPWDVFSDFVLWGSAKTLFFLLSGGKLNCHCFICPVAVGAVQ